MSESWGRLEKYLRDLAALHGTLSLLHWDKAVSMPPLGATGRGAAISALEGAAHQRLVEPELGDLIASLEDDDSLDEPAQASIRLIKRDRDKALRLPSDLVRAQAEAEARAYHAWTQTKPSGDFTAFEPHLKEVFDLKKQEADALGWSEERYDALLDRFEPGMRASQLGELFPQLVEGLKPIVDAVLDATGPEPAFLSARYGAQEQFTFCAELATALGFDDEAGYLAESPHPFSIRLAHGDVRQTTKTQGTNLMSGVFATIHETGHSLYEQGVPGEWDGLPVGRSVSLGIHESQSRMWENHVGRGRPFSEWLLKRLQETFPGNLGAVSNDEFYRGINHPHRSPIRIEADELTYNLHVALRFEIERAMLADQLDVSDLPEAWNEGMERYVGMRPSNHTSGVLQDMHWAIGYVGYFPTYTLGTLYAAEFFATAAKEIGPFDDAFSKGDTSALLGWMRQKVHHQASLYEADELATRIVGHRTSPETFLGYLRTKYSELYSVTI